MSRLQIVTASGPAWADLDDVRGGSGVLMIGHGAGGSADAPDLLAVRDAAVAVGVSVARVIQPYRVAGRRAPAPAARLDEAWREVHAALRLRRGWRTLPFVHAGRSSGARVACRCADATAAAAVIALAFPVHPPGQPGRTRVDELEAVRAPLLVVQGERDAFGQPPGEQFDGVTRRLVQVPGDHSLKAARREVGAAVTTFLTGLGFGSPR